jgi:alpha-tubulin suppressor-like RCC1 family protein
VPNTETKRRSRFRALILGAAIAIACGSSQAHVGCNPTLTCSLNDERFAPPPLPDAGPRMCEDGRRCPAIQVSAGDQHTCAVAAAGELLCWGNSEDARLGENMAVSTDSGAQDAGDDFGAFVLALEHAKQVTAGGAHTCAILDDDSVMCWGRNTQGQVNAASSAETIATPERAGVEAAIQIDAGADHTCALVPQGVMCWGSGRYGQVGRSVSDERFAPALIPGTADATALATGVRHSCALLSGGSVLCWGELIDEASGEPRSTPDPTLVPGLDDALGIAAGGGQSCAMRPDGVVCWGSNGSGQLGDGTTQSSARPRSVSGLGLVLHIAAGGGERDGQLFGHTCAVDRDRHVACWGRNGEGQLGNGETGDSLRPVAVLGRSDRDDEAYLEDIEAVDLGAAHSCALDHDGPIACWGDDSQGQLGRRTRDASEASTRPLRVARFGRGQ